MKKTKTQKGITLIALIITIVVLLILAAVAISSITNDGILGYATNAAGTYNQAVKNEQGMLQEYEDYLTGINGGFEEYSIGDEVTIGSETFYVIKDSAKTESKLLLLAKYNIIADKTNANYLTQSSSAGTVAFSTENYWGNVTTTTDIVEPATIPESHIAAKAAYDYGAQFEGATGRLMTYAEACTLEQNTTFYSKLYETMSWLGSAYDSQTGSVFAVNPYGGMSVQYIYYGDDFDFGVRPVIEISKSKVTPVTAE